MEIMRVGVVGLGKMGSAIARNLLTHGYAVNVWNRTAGKARDLVRDGATEYPTLGALINGSDTVIVMLWGDEAARSVSLGEVIPSVRAEQLMIEMSTLSPAMYDTLEKAAHDRDVVFVAAPVAGSVDLAQTGALTILAGGDADAVERARPLLEVLGSKVIATGSVRASGYLKLANNQIMAAFAATMGELLAFCLRAGVDRRIAIELFTGTFSRASSGKAQLLLNDDTTPRFSLDALLKDLDLEQAAARLLGQPMPVLQTLLPELQQAASRGLGERDYVAMALAEETQSEANGPAPSSAAQG